MRNNPGWRPFLSRPQFVILAILAAGCNKPSSQPTPPSTAEPLRSQALAVTSRMLKAYREAKSYADRATYVEQSVLRGDGVARELPYYQMSLAFKRPNQIRLTITESVADSSGARRGFDVACDGELLRAAMPEIPDQMVEKPAPAELTPDNVVADPLIREHLVQRDLGDILPQLAMLLNKSDDDESAVFPRDSNPRLLESQRLGDADCYRVATSHPEGTRVLWIDAKTFVLRRMELPVDAHRARIDPDGNYLRLSIRIDFDDATFDASMAPETFTMPVKSGARRVRRFVLLENELTAKDAKVGSESRRNE
jgi:hypothetical protein